MWKFHIVFILVSSLLLIVAASGKSTSYGVTKFRVYIHEFVSGPNATLYEVARADITDDSPTSFGLVRVADDLMTSGPDRTTGKLGQAQGVVVNSGLTESAATLNVNYVFTVGKYKGSSITVVGWRLLTLNANPELPIVGGTGIFRLVRGYVVINTYSYDPLTNYLVLIYDFYVYLN